MQLIVKNTKNLLTVSENIFGCAYNEPVIHQSICAYLAGNRQGTHKQKNRSEVKGSGKKPWKQKGTGRARAGSLKSPLWRSGGVTFAARQTNYQQKINKKMYKLAIKSIISELIRQNRIVLLESFSIELPKTKLLLEKIKEISLKNIVLIITNVFNKNLILASRNLHNVNVINVTNINPVLLTNSDNIILTIETIKKIEVMLQ